MKLKRMSSVFVLAVAAVLLLALPASAQTVNCSGVPAWAPNTSYATGQLVTYSGSEYKCVQGHTSETGWEPPNVPALWSLVGSCAAGPTPTATPTATVKTTPTATPTATIKATPSPTPTATANCIIGPPPAPSASNITAASVTLSGPVVDPLPGCSAVTYNWYKNGALIGTTTSPTINVSGLSFSTTYNFTEALVTTQGVGPQSAATVVTTLSDATPTPTPTCGPGVSNFQAPTVTVNSATSATINAIVATATPMPGCTVASYTVNFYANNSLLVNQSGTSYTATGLTPSTTYSFTTALVINGATQSQSAATSVTMPAAATPTPTPTPTSTGGGSCSGIPAWAPNTSYSVGQLVTYNGSEYKCLQSHTSLTGWEPPNVPALWSFVGTCSGGTGGGATPTPTGGGPTPTATPGTTPSGNGGGTIPKHALEGYWQDFTNGATPLTIAQVPTTYDIIAVAFANATTTPGAVDFSIDSGLASALGGYTTSQFIADINTAHGRGQKVIISVGGQNGTISVSDSTSATNFANSVHSLMTTYGFDGVDIDLENGINAQFMTSALQQLSSMSPNLIVTTAPQTIDMQSTGADYFALALDASNIITINNTQYYNSGTMNGCDGNVYSESTENFLTALACIQLKGGIPPSEVGLGLPASPSGAGSGYVSPSTVVAALQCLAQGTNCGSFNPGTTWPGIRGAMDWSINWDAADGYNFANTVKPALNSLP